MTVRVPGAQVPYGVKVSCSRERGDEREIGSGQLALVALGSGANEDANSLVSFRVRCEAKILGERRPGVEVRVGRRWRESVGVMVSMEGKGRNKAQASPSFRLDARGRLGEDEK